MGIDKDGRALAALFKSIPASVKRAIEPAIDQGANEMLVRMKLLAPVDDGDLQMSIRKEEGPRALSVTVAAGGQRTTRPVREGVSATFDYALGTEYGTEETTAQPFFWPAVNSTKKRVRRRIDRAISKAIKEKWDGGS
jgi:HK97 gp10 family phage protein